jgi:cation diffusion facilitator CzcD-associated flavoprotein CzcO
VTFEPVDAEPVDVVVIGSGQGGLSAAYHLRRRGFRSLGANPEDAGTGTFVVLDQDAAPGGAWRHRWDSLQMGTVNGIHELPGLPVPAAREDERANTVLPAYFAEYERRFELHVRRPVAVRSVARSPQDDEGRLAVATTAGTYLASYVVNATGTWTRPHWPYYPGMDRFRGRQLHVHDYRRAEEFAGRRVVVVGAGVSAVQLLEEISRVTETFWVTRREPEWVRSEFDIPARVAAIADVADRVANGLPAGSVVSITGMRWSAAAQVAQDRGVLVRHPMFRRLEEDGLRMPDGSFEPADVILWATGFRPALDHLAPLRLRTPSGGIRVVDSRSVDEPRVFLVGYGPTQYTVGANRAGRLIAATVAEELHRPRTARTNVRVLTPQ